MTVGWSPKQDSCPAGLNLYLGSEMCVHHQRLCVRLSSMTVLKQVYLEFLLGLVAFD